MDKIKEVSNRIYELQQELWVLKDQRDFEEHQKLVGKYYKCFHDSDPPFWVYVYFSGFDTVRNIAGYYLKVFRNGSIEMTNLKIPSSHVDKFIERDMIETTEEEFFGILNSITEDTKKLFSRRSK